ncbi:MAG TPA: helicase-related protein, partial [Roseiflexaceae bacterium]|nr:helicase-related protein [Roseiflexaceae bacterium]
TLIAELERSPRRLLVATDCLSEGINLQQAFDAVIHYDLPWNPNRLEQREGRVDRYGQPASRVRTVLLYGQDNPIDEAVMKVLLRKAVSIHRSLGISVPLPVDSGTVVETLIAALFRPAPRQASLFDMLDAQEVAPALDADERIQEVERAWNRAIEREKESRTRFAQRRIKPEEVARELEESDAVLGDGAAVRRFVHEACARFGAPLRQERQHQALAIGPLPQPVKERIAPLLPRRAKGADPEMLRIAFDEPAPQGVELIGRNHVLTTALADYLLETALAPENDTPLAARCGLIRTGAVAKRTVLLLLRVRMLVESARQAAPTLAEELVVAGYTRGGGALQWLDEPAALELLAASQPAANVTRDERVLGLQSALEQLDGLGDTLNDIAEQRATRLRESHQRVRSATTGGRVTVTPRTPPDVLGTYVLLPTV